MNTKETTNSQTRVYESILDLIASPDNPTPLVRLKKFFGDCEASVYGKLEWYNPFGSVKDRVAKAMIEAAQPIGGRSLIEASSGNTGIALAAIAAVLGIPIEVAVPDGAPREKKTILNLLGATLWETDDELCPLFPSEGARGLAKSIYESPAHAGKYVYPNQYESEVNVEAHYRSTGPEIWKQTEGQVTAFFAGYGTTGTLSGTGRFLKEQNPGIRIIGVEPAAPRHKLSGLKNISTLAPEYIPGILNHEVIDETIGVSDDDAFRTAVQLARREGLMVGPSSGAIIHAVAEYLKREGSNTPHHIVALLPDNAFKYTTLFEKMFAEERGEIS